MSIYCIEQASDDPDLCGILGVYASLDCAKAVFDSLLTLRFWEFNSLSLAPSVTEVGTSVSKVGTEDKAYVARRNSSE